VEPETEAPSRPSSITPEVAERLLSADLKNIVRKVSDGKTLTVSELNRVKAIAADSKDSITHARNNSELAMLLGISRQTLYQWKKLEGAPQPQANGLHPIIAWRQFIRDRGLKPSENMAGASEALKARKLLAEVEQREIRTAILKGEYVPLETVRVEWTTQVGKAIALLRAKFENELPPILSGLDAVAIQEECQRAIDEVCRVLHGQEQEH
jgi:transposase-like protein